MERKSVPRYAGKRILIVDDDPEITVFLEMILNDYGYSHVTSVHSGDDAVRAMKLESDDLSDSWKDSSPYDAILLDIMLPKTNGFELCRRIRDTWGDRPVILLISGYEFTDRAPRYIDSGADDFLNKPLSPKELLHRLEVQFVRHFQSDTLLRRETSGRISECNLDQIGQYTIERVLSWSGGLIVYEAEFSGKPYLLKILTQQAMECEAIRERFEREQEIMAALRHPNIVALIDKGTYHNLSYFVTEYVTGNTLEMYSRRHPNPPFDVVKRIAAQMADAIGYMHKHHIIHRDIKMSNIFIDPRTYQIKIGDFGISYAENYPRLTQPGYSLGTPAYMAPEQFSGGELTPTLDVYSFGATLYHLCTGLPPYSATSAVEFMQKHMNARPPLITNSRPEFPKAWDEFIIDCCMSVDPHQRPQDMKAVLEALNAIEAA